MSRLKLDPKILKKLSIKLGKSEQYIREQISRRSSRCNISSEAELVLWAKSLGIGTSVYVSKLSPHMQNEIRTYKKGDEFNPLIVNTKRIYSSKEHKKKWPETWWGKLLLYTIFGTIVATVISTVILRLIGI